jgi:hypothetical protein
MNSLFLRLLLSVIVAMGVALGGSLSLVIGVMRGYGEAQLLAHGEGAALLLAMELAQPGNQTPVGQQLQIEAVFDSGNFSVVRLADPAGQLVIERVLTHDSAPAPDWFVSIVGLKSEMVSHPVADGWRQIGTISLAADESDVLVELWVVCTSLVWLMLGVTVLWALGVYGLTRRKSPAHSGPHS